MYIVILYQKLLLCSFSSLLVQDVSAVFITEGCSAA